MALTINTKIGSGAQNQLAVGGVRTGVAAESTAKAPIKRQDSGVAGQKGDSATISEEGKTLSVKMGKPGVVGGDSESNAQKAGSSSQTSTGSKAEQLVEQLKKKIEQLKKEIEALKASNEADETKQKKLEMKNNELVQLNAQLQAALKENTKSLKSGKDSGGASMNAQ